MTARKGVIKLLVKMNRDKAYSNILLNSFLRDNDFSAQDKAFISALFYGVIERKITIDYQLSKHLKNPVNKLKPEVYAILQSGVYQIFYMDKIPESAAVNESVKLSKKMGCSYASGLINATLRAIIKSGLLLPDESDYTAYLSVKYSINDWIISRWIDNYGNEFCKDMLEAFSAPAKLVIKINSLRISTDEYIKLLKAENIDFIKNDAVKDSLIIEKSGAVDKLPGFKEGYFHIQDTASQICAHLLDAQPEDRVLDICAAPGGKSFTIAEDMVNRGEIISCDLFEHRVKLISDGAERLGLKIINPIVNDASKHNDKLGEFDRVLCDVPCAGLGIIRRKPEIKYKKEEDILELPDLQLNILNEAFGYLKNGGLLVYSTCSLNIDENDNVINKFIINNKAELVSKKTYFPNIDGTDGFFTALIKKNDE